ncbi:hypothetical protein TI39_contig337g00010 [Zymoseptoria brevis]|uniref:Uncharacterized protein n=1 Tax=Zymoseptoria brevis TaxID=1047168 RepID=A0A0F4GS51_9PEZI|nr:hypothetical protein TI39_contig337g00010 [Zymoseptoria brevis]
MFYKGITTRNRLAIDFKDLNAPADWGLRENKCWPEHLVEDPGFALLTQDPYYKDYPIASAFASNYAQLIPQDVLDEAHLKGFSRTQGFRKREDKHLLYPEAWVFNDGSSSRPLTSEELKDIGILQCKSADCKNEMKDLGIESVAVEWPSQHPTVHETPSADVTPAATADASTTGATPGHFGSGFVAQATAT